MVKEVFRQKKNYDLKPLDMENGLFKAYLSNQKENPFVYKRLKQILVIHNNHIHNMI